MGFQQTSCRIEAPSFTSRVWKEFCRALGAAVSLSSGYHPQSNGQIERANQDQETALRCICARNPASWSTHLTWDEYSHNSLDICSYGYNTIRGVCRILTTFVPFSGAGDRCAIGPAQLLQDLQNLEGNQSVSPAHSRPEPEFG